jgi:hypothetical protein
MGTGAKVRARRRLDSKAGYWYGGELSVVGTDSSTPGSAFRDNGKSRLLNAGGRLDYFEEATASGHVR